MNLEYIDRIRLALAADPAPPADCPGEREPVFVALARRHRDPDPDPVRARHRGPFVVDVRRRVGTLPGAVAAAMVCAASDSCEPSVTSRSIVAGLERGTHDEVLRAVAPRRHAMTRRMLADLLTEPGDVAPEHVRVPAYQGHIASLDDARVVDALVALACILDIECSVSFGRSEVLLRPLEPRRSFGGRSIHRWSIDVRQHDVLATSSTAT